MSGASPRRAGQSSGADEAHARAATCRISALRDGRYRVHWTSRRGNHGMDGPFPNLDVAAVWCEGYERDLGWRWVR